MSSVSFYCAVCGEALKAPASHAGSVTACSRCSRSVPVPGFPAQSGFGFPPVYPPEILSMDVTFACRGCKTHLVVDARWEGHEVDCPRCDCGITVPLWSGRAVDDSPPARAPKVTLTAE